MPKTEMRDILAIILEERKPGGILDVMLAKDDMTVEEVLQLSPEKMDRLDAVYNAFLFAYILGVKAERRRR